MRINQAENRMGTLSVSGTDQAGKKSALKEEKEGYGVAVNGKEESEEHPQSLLEKLIVQKKDINDQLNQLQLKAVKMTDEQKKEKRKQLTGQLKMVNQAIIEENNRIMEEQKEKLKEQQEKKEAEGKTETKNGNAMDSISLKKPMTVQEILSRNVNSSILSAAGGLDNLKLMKRVEKTQEHTKAVLEGEIEMGLRQGGSIESKMDELNEIGIKMSSRTSAILEEALTPLTEIPMWEHKTPEELEEERKEADRQEKHDKMLIETSKEEKKKSPARHTESTQMQKLPDDVSNEINYRV